MNITEVRIKLMHRRSDRLRAFASVTIDNDFVVHDLRVIEGRTGFFVAMPSRKLSDSCAKCGAKNELRARFCGSCGGQLDENRAARGPHPRDKFHVDVAHPINTACREMLQSAVLAAYREEEGRADEGPGPSPDYVPEGLDELADEYPEPRDAEATEARRDEQPDEEPTETPGDEQFDEELIEALHEERPDEELIEALREERPDEEPLEAPREERRDEQPIEAPREEWRDEQPIEVPRDEQLDEQPIEAPRDEQPDEEPIEVPRDEQLDEDFIEVSRDEQPDEEAPTVTEPGPQVETAPQEPLEPPDTEQAAEGEAEEESEDQADTDSFGAGIF